ncbi:MAG: transporter substrate-binding domain-containing protein [Ignavibacteria bacterium]|nr:transporter substrate-binding domain-containing protein [Ignavibacteria bacterium]
MKSTFIFIVLLSFVFVSCSKKNEKINDISQLSDKKICVLTGSAGDIAARKFFPNAKFLDMVSAADAALTVKTGKADAFIHNKSVLLNIIDKESELIILDKPISEVLIAGAVRKNNETLLNEINKALNKLKAEGILYEMKRKWISPKYQSVPELPLLQTNNQNSILKMGTCARAEPLSFLYNNIITGFDIELALRIGEIIGKKIEITDMTFESLIPALQLGKIDFAFSNFNVTEERKKFVDFSEEYLSNDISVLVKK